MKRIVCLIVTAWLTVPAFAADDRCANNLQQLDDERATKITAGDSLNVQIDMLQNQAKEAQSAGDQKACIVSSERALQLLDSANRQGSGDAGNGTGGASQ
ncbi:hypothetical protein D3C77_595300 [compost metagenome]